MITVLVSEGYTAPFLAIIKSGECHVLRHVEVLRTLPNGKKVHKIIGENNGSPNSNFNGFINLNISQFLS